jgi:DNA-3-methyladenine glycosylase II
MRRPDILPVGMYMTCIWLFSLPFFSTGDLGVQRGLLRWHLSQHSSDHSLGTLPEKSDVSSNRTGEDAENSNNANPEAPSGIPPPLTPSTRRSLEQTDGLERQTRPLPSGLSVSVLKGRLEGKKVK